MAVRLHCFAESGNAYKAALTFACAGIDWQPVFVDFFHGATRTPEFRALNPMGEVPVAETPDGILTQSGVIQLWAAERTGRLVGRTPVERNEVLRWLFFDNHRLSAHVGTLRFLMNFAPPEKRPAEAIRWLSGRLRASLKILESELSGRDWLSGRSVTLADLACCSYLYYPEPFDFRREDWPAIDRWLTRIAALPGWQHPYRMLPRTPGLTPDWPPDWPPDRTPDGAPDGPRD